MHVINEFPCLKNKCLVYPACKDKPIIKCHDLEDYYYILEKTYGDKYNYTVRKQHAWLIIRSVFPKLVCMRGNTLISDVYYDS